MIIYDCSINDNINVLIIKKGIKIKREIFLCGGMVLNRQKYGYGRFDINNGGDSEVTWDI